MLYHSEEKGETELTKGAACKDGIIAGNEGLSTESTGLEALARGRTIDRETGREGGVKAARSRRWRSERSKFAAAHSRGSSA